jgi:hypothetical protein
MNIFILLLTIFSSANYYVQLVFDVAVVVVADYYETPFTVGGNKKKMSRAKSKEDRGLSHIKQRSQNAISIRELSLSAAAELLQTSVISQPDALFSVIRQKSRLRTTCRTLPFAAHTIHTHTHTHHMVLPYLRPPNITLATMTLVLPHLSLPTTAIPLQRKCVFFSMIDHLR